MAMIPYRKGLVAPQNTFLETIIRSSASQHNQFLLANARIADFPIIFANDGFCQLTGFSKAELLHQGAVCRFMYGDLTDSEAVKRLSDAFDQQIQHQVEVLLYKKNKTPLWLLQRITPIKDENEAVVMLLVSVRNITALKQSSEEESTKVSLSKFARLACRTMTRYRNTNGQQQQQQQQRQMISPSSLSIEMLKSTSTVSPMINMNDDVIPRYRPEAPKTPGHIILHYSGFKSIWDWVILVLTFYTAVMVPFNAAFQGKTMDNVPVLVIDSVVDVVFFVDIFLNFHTTFVGSGGEVISDPGTIRKNYLRTWFIVDLLSCLPYDVFNAFPDSTENVSSLFSALKVVRLLRLGRVARKLDHYMEYGAAVLVLLIVMFVLIAHWFACLWFTIGDMEATKGVHYGWLQRLGREVNMTHRPRRYNASSGGGGGEGGGVGKTTWEGGPHDSLAYATALYFTLSCMTSVGFGNVSAHSEYEKIFTICMMILGSLLYATIFGNVTTIFQQMYSTTGRYHEMLSSIREFMKIHSVPKSLSERVVDYVVSTWSSSKGIDTDKVLNYCPADLKADICVHLNRSVFTEHPSFRLASEGCLRALAVHFNLGHWAPGNTVFHQGESVDVLCFVVSGSLEVIQDDEIVAILSKGDVIGDQFWKESSVGQCAANVRALTYCDLHVIRREPLLEVLRFYKPFAASFARTLKLTHNLRRRLVFRKVADIIREKELAEKNKNDPPIEFSDDHPVRKLISRFRKLSYTTASASSTALDDATEVIYDHQGGEGRGGGGGGDQDAADAEVVRQAETSLLGGDLLPSVFFASSSSSSRSQENVVTRKPSNVAQQPPVSKWNALFSLGENCRTFGRRSNSNNWGEGEKEEEEEGGSRSTVTSVAEKIAMRRRRDAAVYRPYSENEAFENNEDPKEMNERTSYFNLSFHRDIVADEAMTRDERQEFEDQRLAFSSEIIDNGSSVEKRSASRPNDEISHPKTKSKKLYSRTIDLSVRETKREDLQQLSVEVLRSRDESAEKIYQIQEDADEEQKEEPRRKQQTRYKNDTNSDNARYKGSDKAADLDLGHGSSKPLNKYDDSKLTLSKNLARQDNTHASPSSRRENADDGLSFTRGGSHSGALVPAQRKMLKFLNNIKTNLHLEIEELHHRMDNIDQHLDLLTAVLRPETAEAVGAMMQSAASSSTSPPPADYPDLRSPGAGSGVAAEMSRCYSVSTDVLSCASGVTNTTEIAVDLANDDDD